MHGGAGADDANDNRHGSAPIDVVKARYLLEAAAGNVGLAATLYWDDFVAAAAGYGAAGSGGGESWGSAPPLPPPPPENDSA
eukprot:13086615-Ditylum_brightwellii.AAC.1